MGTVSQKVSINAVLSSICKIVWTFIALYSFRLLAQYLGADGFGKYTTILAFFFMFSAFGELGVNQMALREISYEKNEGKEDKIISIAFSLKIIAAIVIFFIAFVLLFLLKDFYEIDIRLGISLVSVGLLFSSGYQVLTTIFQKRLLAYKVALAELLGRIVNLIWVIFCIQESLSLIFVVFGMIFSWMATFIVVFILAKKEVNFKFKIDLLEYKKFLKKSLPLGLSAIISFIYFKSDTLILSAKQGFYDVGIYQAAYKIVENIAYFPSMFMGLVMPIYARHIFTETKRFRKAAKRVFDAIVFLGMGVFWGIMALAPKIIAITTAGREEFGASVVVLKILSIAIMGIFLGQYFNTLLIVANHQKILLKIFLFCAIFNVSLNLLFIPQFSYMASAIISSATEVLVPCLSASVIYFKMKYQPVFFSLFKTFLAGLIMYFFLVTYPEIPIYIQIPVGGMIYFFLSCLFRVFSKEDLKKIINKT
jgi:O-antigen/teichoic acid export membrane protein